MPPFNKSLVVTLCVLPVLAGCSEYLDRRDTIAMSAGDGLASAKVTQMVDPWPRASANNTIAYSGDRMQAAYERYRTGRVIQPRGMDTSSSYTAPQQQQQPAQNNTTPVGPTVTQSAPVK